ncbi:phosphatidate cytidylyltransferase, mitochondrial isoform X1 [Oryza glaberrima]|uniref:phosphatidate cytidylyltransferase, mitochondrial isoform X1 n=1 Tax=Oryza glaberrima TaxID=4538 RepID=UPI00224C2F94|nr:phosphatidate cytidylyltransferase, mitochondrial isoform X1 [Oryza glaberrima]
MRPAEEVARAAALAGPLGELLPPVDFCCAYGSTLLHARPDASSMVDYILGVPDPLQWHSENLERNPDHYSGWMARLGPGAITRLADNIGVGVYFNPFVEWRDKRIKYGVVRMKDLAMDVLTWDRFYLSGRLQKPVHVLVDNWDIRKINTINLKMATSASLLLLPAEFTEYDLYAQICSLSYMGDLRMLFAEDKNKVKKIVEGSFPSFQSMYRPLIQEYIAEGLLKTSSYGQQKAFHQDCGASATNELFSYLPWTIQRRLQGRFASNCKEMPTRASVSSKDVTATCVRKALRRRVMVSSARQAMSGLLASGGAVAARYLGKKISKAWKSRTV